MNKKDIKQRIERLRKELEIHRHAYYVLENPLISDEVYDSIFHELLKLEEENPALGWRAIRIGLDRPGLLRSQLRAMLRAGGGRQLRIMFPMIATVAEFDAAKAIVEREVNHLKRHNYELPVSLDLGVMVEVPSLLWQLDELCERVEFLSVGSNDLVQYLYAADRDNKRVSKRYDNLSIPVLRALKRIVDKAAGTNTSVTLCGEMGGKPLDAVVLAAIGYRGLSMSPSSIGPVKAAIIETNLAHLSAYVSELMDARDGASSLRPKLLAYAEKHGIPL